MYNDKSEKPERKSGKASMCGVASCTAFVRVMLRGKYLQSRSLCSYKLEVKTRINENERTH